MVANIIAEDLGWLILVDSWKSLIGLLEKEKSIKMALKKQWFQTNKQTNNGFRTSWSVGEIPGQGAKIPYFF